MRGSPALYPAHLVSEAGPSGTISRPQFRAGWTASTDDALRSSPWRRATASTTATTAHVTWYGGLDRGPQYRYRPEHYRNDGDTEPGGDLLHGGRQVVSARAMSAESTSAKAMVL